MAAPVRAGTTFVPPAHYAAWDREYVNTVKALRAEGTTPNLYNVLSRFAKNDNAAFSPTPPAVRPPTAD